MNNFGNLIFKPFSKLFIQSIFYLQIHSLFTVQFCLQSCQGGYLFLSCSQSCQGWKIFLVEITPREKFLQVEENLVSRDQILNQLNADLSNTQVGLDFLYTAWFVVPLTFPCSFLRKIQKTSKNPLNIPSLTVLSEALLCQRGEVIFSCWHWQLRDFHQTKFLQSERFWHSLVKSKTLHQQLKSQLNQTFELSFFLHKLIPQGPQIATMKYPSFYLSPSLPLAPMGSWTKLLLKAPKR